jgi:hypothetical protein
LIFLHLFSIAAAATNNEDTQTRISLFLEIAVMKKVGTAWIETLWRISK